MYFKYNYVAVGGTFDLLHKGHKALILKAFEVSKFVTIGITTDKFNKNTFEDQSLRLRNLKTFLKGKKYQIIWLDDIFGTTLEDSSLEALIVSPETKHSAQIINRERVKKGFKKLDIIVQSFIKDEQNKVISSTRIRNGEISPAGISYKQLLLKIAGKNLSEEIKQELKKPFGKISSLREDRSCLSEGQRLNELGTTVTVGDITTKKFLELGIIPKLAIVDLKVQRKVAFENLSQLGFTKKADIKVKNEPGQISRSLILAIQKPVKLILVEGEEDLAAIPAILLSPLGVNVFYGQPKKGAVLVKVTLEIKDRIRKLLI